METVRKSIQSGADVNATYAGSTALITATRWGHLALCKLLLERGARVNAQQSDGWTALMVALNGQHTDIMHLLLQWHADPTVHAPGGTTAMDIAEHKLPEWVGLLKSRNKK